VNYELFGEFEYEQIPLENIGPFLGDGETVYHFLVRDHQFEDCAEDLNFGPIECQGGGECFIGQVNADVMPCNESGNFYVLLNFGYENVGEMGFRVQGNGNNYGNFEYEDLPIEIGPLTGDGITIYEFVAIDNQFEDCSNWTAIDPVDCDTTTNECTIFKLMVTHKKMIHCFSIT